MRQVVARKHRFINVFQCFQYCRIFLLVELVNSLLKQCTVQKRTLRKLLHKFGNLLFGVAVVKFQCTHGFVKHSLGSDVGIFVRLVGNAAKLIDCRDIIVCQIQFFCFLYLLIDGLIVYCLLGIQQNWQHCQQRQKKYQPDCLHMLSGYCVSSFGSLHKLYHPELSTKINVNSCIGKIS